MALDDLICHVFLPRKLPSKEQPNLRDVEADILALFGSTIESVDRRIFQDALPRTKKVFQIWRTMQTLLKRGSPAEISKLINSMQKDDMLAMYIEAQNAGFLISQEDGDKEGEPRIIISSFQASMSSEAVMSTPGDLLVTFPESSIEVTKSTLLLSPVLTEHLCCLHQNTFSLALPKSRKAGTTFDEVRDVADPMFVTDWLTSALTSKSSKVNEGFPSVLKKIRDSVNWNSSLLPFRRSGMYTIAKVVLQISLIQELGESRGYLVFKSIMIELMLKTLSRYNQTKKWDWDLQRQMMAKIARRGEKLRANLNNYNIHSQEIIDVVSKNIRETLANVRKTMDMSWQDHCLTVLSNEHTKLSDVYIPEKSLKQGMERVNDHIETRLRSMNSTMNNAGKHSKIAVPSCPTRWKGLSFPIQESFTISYNNCQSNYSRDIFLRDIETWIWQNLDEYSNKNYSSHIRKLMVQYTTAAITQYLNDPLGNSRLALTVLKCLQVLDHIAVEEYHMLKEHKTGVDLEILSCLLLPLKSEMELLHSLENYFKLRDSTATLPSLISEESPSSESFSVRFARKSTEMQDMRNEILRSIEDSISMKFAELERAREILDDLQHKLKMNGSHDSVYSSYYETYSHPSHCTRCSLESQIQRQKFSVRPYERSLPLGQNHQFAIVFELMIPTEIACLRDMLHFWQSGILLRKIASIEESNLKTWISYPPLKPWNRNMQSESTHLVSTIKAVRDSHYANISIELDDDSFILTNGRNHVYGSNPLNLSSKSLKDRCTFKIDATKYPNYARLQWAVSSMENKPNRILAVQNECPPDLSLQEFYQFGTLRAGNRLQYRNIIASLVNGQLSLSSEPVLQLLCQAQWEAGPVTDNVLRDSHVDFSDHQFATAALKIIEELVDANAKNWSEPNTLLSLITITTRILELTEQKGVKVAAANLLRKCRLIAEQWVPIVKKIIAKSLKATDSEISSLKRKIIDAAICISISYNVSVYHQEFILQTSEDLIMWLKCITTLYDEILCNVQNQLSDLRKSLVRLTVNIGVALEDRINIVWQQYPHVLSDFTLSRWKGADSKIDEWKWNKYSTPNEQIYFCENILAEGAYHTVQLDVLTGKFLVDGSPIGRLPEEMMLHKNFQWTFSSTNFEVQPNLGKIFTTASSGEVDAVYVFSMDGTQLIIKEKIFDDANGRLEMIPFGLITTKDLTTSFVTKYSHWWSPSQATVMFRPKNYDDPQFFADPPFTLNLSTFELKENSSGRILVSQRSALNDQVTTLLQRIELKTHLNVWYTHPEDGRKMGKLEMECERLGIKFYIDDLGNFISHEYPGMKISQQQNLQTLVGLQNMIILERNTVVDCLNTTKKIIVPHGQISISRESGSPHQSIRIELGQLRNPPYFAFEVDERLKILTARRSQTAWLYLAALHGATASPLPDPFTGLSGTEMAFKILQSGHSWSCQPYDQESLTTMEIIAAFSPSREYYPKHLKCMQTVTWPLGLSSIAAHDGYMFLIWQLASDSNRLKVVFNKMYAAYDDDDDETLNKKRHTAELCNRIHGITSNTLALREYFRQTVYENEFSRVLDTFCDGFSDFECKPKLYIRSSLLTHRTDKISNVRTLAALCQDWGAYIPKVPDIESFLITYSALKVRNCTPKEMIKNTLVEFESWESAFRDRWVDMYFLALDVNKNEWRSEWTFILTTLALKGVQLEHLLFLQAVAVFSSYFQSNEQTSKAQYLKPLYINPSSTISSDSIRSIFKETADEFQTYHGKYSTSRQETEARNLHDAEVSHQVARYTNSVVELWPTPSYDYRQGTRHTDSKLNLHQTISKINALLREWYDNLQLKNFIQEVRNEMNRCMLNNNKQFITQPSITSCHGTSVLDIFREKQFNKTNSGRSNRFLCNFDFDVRVPVSDYAVIQKARKIYRSGKHGFILSSHRKNASSKDYEADLKKMVSAIQKFHHCLNQCLYPSSNEHLMDSGIFCRLTLSCLLPKLLVTGPSNDFYALVGAIAVLQTQEQRLVRCITYLNAGSSMSVALEREVETIGHEDWSPMEHPKWLILELEMNMMIRPIQYKVAKQMMCPDLGKNSVLQLNMGEGKTALIAPMLAAELADGKQLCRITVLKSIFQTNLTALRHTLGGMLNQRIYVIPCRRDVNMGPTEANTILELYKECMRENGIVVTLPEYRLSFQLKAYEMSRASRINEATSVLGVQKWINLNTRDILDESDEILSVKYQLLYTVGNQIPIAGESLRWELAQKLLKLLTTKTNRMKDLLEKYGEGAVEIRDNPSSHHPGIFTPCRLLKKECYQDLIDMLAEDFLDVKLITFPALTKHQRKIVKEFLTNDHISKEDHAEVMNTYRDQQINLETILILSGYLRYGVLQTALGKRWRVNYGVNPTGTRKMAVPFKAKDVASERTEFGHPDMAIILTQLSYYYSGLNDEQLLQCFHVLNTKHPDPDTEYASWLLTIPKQRIDPSVKKFKGINLADFGQRTKILFPLLRKTMAVIDFWLSSVVFPKESKQFPGKMTTTAWDLVHEAQSKLTTGFSGTNDSSLLYPLNISQNDLPELQKTNEEVEAVLMKPENNNYDFLPSNATGVEILRKLTGETIPILIDCGALMLDLSNEGVADKWLEINPYIEAVVYFNKHNVLTVKPRNGKKCQYELSPFRERLHVCAIYLDDEHTRGTDLKFPKGSRACVTVGSGLTRDKLAQACMRMRMLGKGHTVSFWSSLEAHNKIKVLPGLSVEKVCSEHVLAWVRYNSIEFRNESLVYWTMSAVNYCRKTAAEFLFEIPNQDPQRSIPLLGERCTEKETIKLESMYGQIRQEALFINTIWGLFNATKTSIVETITESDPKSLDRIFTTVSEKVFNRCKEIIPEKKHFTQLLEEEQEKELEDELEEEREQERPPKAKESEHCIGPEVKKALRTGKISVAIDTIEQSTILNLPFALKNTQMWKSIQVNCWRDRIYVTKDLINTIVPDHVKDNLDPYIRPVFWVVVLPGDVTQLLLLSPFEVNYFISGFRKNLYAGSLHMYTPRYLPEQEILLNLPELCLPVSRGLQVKLLTNSLLAPLSLFSGTLYFGSDEEQHAMMEFLGIFAEDDKSKLEYGRENGYVDQNGFIKWDNRQKMGLAVNVNCFRENPEVLVKAILFARSYGYIPSQSHLFKLAIDGMKTDPVEFRK